MPASVRPDDPALTVRDIFLHGRRLDFRERTQFFSDWREATRRTHTDGLRLRLVLSPMDREVLVRDADGHEQRMLMFGSNNYLNLATHPYVRERVRAVVDRLGAGVGGPPLLNGYSALHRELEERLAAFEHVEDAVLYGSGYSANVGLMSSLPTKRDLIFCDELHHASCHDGLALGGFTSVAFRHNDMAALEALLAAADRKDGDVFVGIEGVYSMDGDLAPLDEAVALCRRYGAILLLDDAHGTGISGPGGTGTAKLFGVEGQVDVVMGTFSKAFGVSGGFVAAPKAVCDYLRLFSRAYIFSASLSLVNVAAVLAGLDLLEKEPEIHARLRANMAYLSAGLRRLGFNVDDRSAAVPLTVPPGMDIQQAAYAFHRRGLFLNHIDYPAVKYGHERFRVSIMAQHTEADLDRLLTGIEEVWAECAPSGDGQPRGPVAL
ncbi:MAG TPA: aminotransferase class I/II-fold pyridoxal phosphate-dependent enzyme [Rubricoccaceae bacterium]|nr:aminotransferase class I/II-fold pyridoxal phosphate-dependent enzyme [Rubricoccaceae bacterium]